MVLNIERAVWGLLDGTLELSDFEEWVYASETLRDDVGTATHLALLEAQYRDAETVLRLFEPWAAARYGQDVELVRSYRVLSLCRAVMAGDGELLMQVRELLHEASNDPRYAETADRWRDEAWGELARIDDEAEPLPVGVNPALVTPEFIARMNAFAEEVRPRVLQACGYLIVRYGQPRES